VVAESVSSREFRAAYGRVKDEQKQFEITWAIEEIEQDPRWGRHRFVGPSDSPYSGFIIDLSVEGYGIVYRIADKGAAVELWQLFEFPAPPKEARAVRPGPVPMM
jgi:hypothetical protein